MYACVIPEINLNKRWVNFIVIDVRVASPVPLAVALI
jgi:hypothetical protein